MPNFPPEAVALAKERDEIRKDTRRDPLRVAELNRNIQVKVAEHRRKKWQQHLDQCDLRQECKKLWRTVKALSGTQPGQSWPAIKFTKPIFSPKVCAQKFNQMYFPSIKTKSKEPEEH